MSDQTTRNSFLILNRHHLCHWPWGKLQSVGAVSCAYAAMALASSGNAMNAGGGKPVTMAFPDEKWALIGPKEAGFADVAAIGEIGKLMEKAKANGVLIRNGRLVRCYA